ncbi:1,2-phenylacetyl-CoA epoxidase subunit PaaD [Novosphingobium pentaromativorans]|uniref:Phenylacetate-CoA oxygenase, PaaJ subunit n=1 Tax=Novosphingobium pentaromativorans US6-1 TaxID=1088721 RepID=G6EHH9_9SPHN|nr:1,2-phenylacetyl-CoA epoxidase subunit PaaD [Novosphingobium pentaromativorans]AIT81870.1 phenylacetate-CoA oxygenase [Novosphingobium pentaromativorans US6-1]EHJ59468.1 phenylacetate-CoA oxygenase, PaaJ subunit [Novosphingobium pentaromativorans US6-1]
MDAAPPFDGALAARIEQVLADVPDPEIPAVSVLDLGIVRGLAVENGQTVVSITPTYTGCPATLVIERSIRNALDQAGLNNIALKRVLSPPWSTDMISDAGREKLRAYGISPPPFGADARSLRGNDAVACPRCGSLHTHEVSRFGSTPCKALWQCDNCKEPFDSFKCH